jgi:hypothetical protein
VGSLGLQQEQLELKLMDLRLELKELNQQEYSMVMELVLMEPMVMDLK